MTKGVQETLRQYGRIRKNMNRRVKRMKESGVINQDPNLSAYTSVKNVTVTDLKKIMSGKSDQEQSDIVNKFLDAVVQANTHDMTSFAGQKRMADRMKDTLSKLGYNVSGYTGIEISQFFAYAEKIVGKDFDYRVAMSLLEATKEREISIKQLMRSPQITNLLSGAIQIDEVEF